MFPEKSYCGLRRAEQDAATHQRLSNITVVISELIVVKVKNSLGTISD